MKKKRRIEYNIKGKKKMGMSYQRIGSTFPHKAQPVIETEKIMTSQAFAVWWKELRRWIRRLF